MANLAFTLQSIRSRVRRCTPTAGGFSGCCPAHDDRVASFSFALKGDRVVLHCQAGCPTERVLDALGLEWEDLFSDDALRGRRAARKFSVRPQPAPKEEDAPPDYEPLLSAARSLPNHRARLLQLADELGAAPASREAYADAADALGVVWLPAAPSLARLLPYRGRGWKPCWAVPERDAGGRVVGIARRYPGGRKKQMAGGKRGLTYAPAALAGAPLVLVPEGASDVVSLMACGLAAVGRPSNVGGAEALSELFASLRHVTQVVVLGENDRKPDGRWPGREGMERVAGVLASSLPSTATYEAVPSGGGDGKAAKDAREWLAGRSGENAGAEFLAALALTLVHCPHNPLSNDHRGGDCGDVFRAGPTPDTPDHAQRSAPLPDPVASLPAPPPAFSCRRGKSTVLRHEADPARHRAVRFACDGWGCPVCRERNAHQWVMHLADRVAEAAAAGRPLLAGEVSRSALDGRLKKALARRKADWAALELVPGVFLALAAVAPGSSAPEGVGVIDLGEARRLLAEWAAGVRTGPEPFSRRAKKLRPVRTSKGWRLNRPEPSGEWRKVCAVDVREIDPIVAAVRGAGARVTCETTDAGERREAGSSLVWLVEWRSDPEVTGRVMAALGRLDEGPAVVLAWGSGRGGGGGGGGGKRAAEDDPGWSPWGEGGGG